MGRTYNNHSKRYDEEISSQRSGKHHKHSNNRKTGGMKTLNSYVEEDYDDSEEFEEYESTDTKDT
jgi:hypothetical protein